jgi:hypothetical protein
VRDFGKLEEQKAAVALADEVGDLVHLGTVRAGQTPAVRLDVLLARGSCGQAAK